VEGQIPFERPKRIFKEAAEEVSVE
jgi:hypothetical protein